MSALWQYFKMCIAASITICAWAFAIFVAAMVVTMMVESCVNTI